MPIGVKGNLLHHHGSGAGAYLLGAGSPLAAVMDGAWSLRKINSLATNCANVRRDFDNATADIGWDGAKGIDQTALIAHVTNNGANPTANGYVQILYDQSSPAGGGTLNARDLLEPTPQYQLQIVNNGGVIIANGLPAMYCPDQSRGMLTNSFTAYTGTAITGFVVGILPSAASNASPQFLALLPTTVSLLDSAAGAMTLLCRQDSELIGKTGNLVDSFATQQAQYWNNFTATTLVTASQLHVACQATYPGPVSVANYDFTNSQVSVRIPQRANVGNGTTETQVQISVDASNQMSTIISAGNITFRERAAGSNSDAAVAYSSTNHKWVRMRHSGSTIYWDTAPDSSGVPGTWTNQRSKTIAMTSPVNAQVKLLAGYFGTEPSPGTAIFDNFNTSLGATATTNWAVERAITMPVSAGATASTLQQITTQDNNGTYSISVDGNTPVSGSGSTTAFNGNRFGLCHNGLTPQSATGLYVSELLASNRLVGATDQSTIQASQRTYWGTPNPSGSTDPSSGYTLIDQDLFATDDLSANWTIYNNGTMTSSAGQWMSSQVSISGGVLSMAAKRVTTPVNGYNVIGGGGYWQGMASDAFKRGGLWECRVRCDAMAGVGFAILMWPQDPANWPEKGEIDVIEVYSTNTSKFGGESNFHLDTTLNSGRHLKAPGSTTHSSAPNVAAGSYQIDWTTYHKVQVAWIPGQFIQVYIDGVEVSYTTDLTYVPSGTSAVPMRFTFQQEHYNSADSVVSTTPGLLQISEVKYYAAP